MAIKLGTSSTKMTGKSSYDWKLRDLVLNNPYAEEIPVNIRKYFNLTECKNKAFQNLTRKIK